MQKVAYCYSRPDYAFVGEAMTGRYAPANATFTEPAPKKDGFTQVFRPQNTQNWPYSGLEKSLEGDDGDWYYIEDHRATDKGGDGLEYWLPDEGDDWQSQPRIMRGLGPLPAGAVTVRPEKPAPSAEELFMSLLAERDRRIAATDYLLMADYPLSADDKVAVEAYRQALRDLPEQDGAPWDGGKEATPWPDLPAFLIKEAV